MKRLLLLLSSLLLCFPILAQQRDASVTFGLDSKDAAAVKEIRYKMAKIRKHRPTVALVLSGGGAKGAATVGALKYMEELKLPVDMVLGTSIGGLLGALYSMGYSADYLDTLIHNINWDMALSDKVDRSYVPYSRIRYKEKYMLSFPFYYRTEDYNNYLAGDIPFAPGRNRQLRLGAQGNEGKANSMIQQNLIGSLPSGFVFGQNVNHIISSRTVGYSDSTDFFKFPIPFACVSTDIASGKAKIWHSGSINLAMRSTMSIPGLFAPVRTGGMVLVDGGMRNNFPVNIAREMGADIVIGIDLSDASPGADDISNLGDILMSSIDLMSNDIFETNINSVDIHIHPNLKGYNMLSFNAVAVDTMFVRGYKAAQEKEADFMNLRRRLGADTLKLQAKPAVDIGETSVYIDDVEIVGVPEKDANYIKAKMFVKPGCIANRRVIEEDIAAIFGKGAFDYVTYELRGKEEPYKLRIRCKKGPMHQLGFSARIDTQDLVSLLLNVGLNTNAMSGSSLDITTRISSNPYLDIQYAYNAPHFSTFNIRSMLRYTGQNNFFTGGAYNDFLKTNYSISFLLATQEIFFSNMHWSSLDVKLGLRNQYLKLYRVMSTETETGQYDFSGQSGDYPSAFIDGRVETLDNGYFPTKGVSAGIRGDVVSHIFNPNAEGLFAIASVDGMIPVSFGRFTLIPQGYMRFIIGKNVPLLFSNVVGGDMRSRYLEQQFPFVGVADASVRSNYLALARLDARLRVGNNSYVSVMGNAMYDWPNFQSFDNSTLSWGVGAGYSFNSIAGPLKAQVFWSSLTKKVGVYLSFGYNF